AGGSNASAPGQFARVHLAKRGSFLNLQAGEVPQQPAVLARLSAGEEPGELTAILGDPDAEQSGAGRAAVPAGSGLLAHLRADAHREPDARLALHARRLPRRHGDAPVAGSLARR